MDNLSDILKNRLLEVPKPVKKTQATYNQHIAITIAEGFEDIKNAGMYMGIVKRRGADYAKSQFDYVMGRSNIKNKIAYFLWLMKTQDTNTNGTNHTK